MCGSDTIIVGYAGCPPESNPRDLQMPNAPRVEALLDSIRSTFNVGSMFRTADGAGLSHLHLCGLTPSPENPKVQKTALGAENSIPWTYYRNSMDAAHLGQSRGMRLWAVEIGQGSESLFDAMKSVDSRPILLIVGNEVSGVDSGLLDLCEKKVWVPMQGYKRSLNVAIAFSILVYFLRYSSVLSPTRHTSDRK